MVSNGLQGVLTLGTGMFPKDVEKIGLLNDFQGAHSIAGLYYQGLRVDITFSQPRKSSGHKDTGCTFGDVDSLSGFTGRGRSIVFLRKRGFRLHFRGK
jgi:hypothetical protein